MPRRTAWLPVLLTIWCLIGLGPTRAQVRPMYDWGANGLTQLLQQLQTTGSVLHTGAHPDDEDSAFLARTARGDHARVAYLALNRGEGGQNIIGPELFDALGVIRTEELLQARRLDGAKQYFTRTFDYGFSKTRAEAASKWNEQEVLGDMVRVIRMFRPLVVYSRFSGTPADGHGQHQFAGYLTPKAFAAAGDPSQFPEQLREGLRPWQPRKLYRGVGFRADPAEATLTIQTGIVDPVIGRSYAEIAAQGRSQHKSQQMGSIEPLGPAATGLQLIERRASAPAREQSVFDGIDVTLEGLPRLVGLPPGSLSGSLERIDAAVIAAIGHYDPLHPSRIVQTLADGLKATRAARTALASMAGNENARADADFLLAIKEREFSEALAQAAGVVVDPLSDRETVVPGGTLQVDVRTFASEPSLVTIQDATVKAPAAWVVQNASASGQRDDNPFGRREVPTRSSRFRITVPRDAPLTQPYYLALPRQGDSYRWPDGSAKAMPFDAPLVTATVTMGIGGVPVTLTRDVEYRFADRVRGELRREVNVVPAVAVGVDSPLLIVPMDGSGGGQRLVVTATSFADGAITGRLRLRVPSGWSVTPVDAPFTLGAAGDTTSAAFTVTPPARRSAGTFTIPAEAVTPSQTFTRDMQVIAYPHIQTHRIYSTASSAAEVIDLKVAPVRLGYIMGSGDEVPEALRRMGVDVTLITDDMLATGDLSRFETIVVGIRASEARPAFVANNGRLHQFMERGGTLIVQYQQGGYEARNLPPYPAEAPVNSRVTDETAPVRILVPGHAVFTFPNRITEADFEGWVQERNLYAFNTFDPRYTALLESADPGEAPQRGGEVYATVGKGRYVYTAYAWFRQLPAGVPGAYRQFANLISLPRAPRIAGSPAPGAVPRTGAAAPQAGVRTRPSR